MRRPGLFAFAGLAISIAGVILGWRGLTRLKLRTWDPARADAEAMVSVGSLLLVGGILLALFALHVHRKRAHLLAGTTLIARWRVGTPDWALFRRRDAARDGLFRSLDNCLRLPATVSPEGIDIRVGHDAMLVGETCYGIGVGFLTFRGDLVDVAWVEGDPGMIEFTRYRPSSSSPSGRILPRLFVMRVPVPHGAHAEAQKLIDHFARTINQDRRNAAFNVFPLHFQAAVGDAGETETARTEDGTRRWHRAGIFFLATGGVVLFGSLQLTGDVSVSAGTLNLVALGGGSLAAVGILLIVYAALRRL